MVTKWTEAEASWMREAVELSRRGYPAPNPRVGAVVVRGGRVVGRGWHDAAGEEHAEIAALREAGEEAKGATLFVTLEPCAHHGKTPPCVDRICDVGVASVVYATPDPNPEARGGANRLAERGIETRGGLLESEAAEVNRVFLGRHELGRPWVVVKAGISLDGRIATSTGESKWITGLEARKRAHELRAELGSVLVGARTIELDDPLLTVREVEVKRQPTRIVLDWGGHLSGDQKVFRDGAAPTVWVTKEVKGDLPPQVDNLCIKEEFKNGVVSLIELLRELGSRGEIGVLVEGGGATIGGFFEQGLVDEVELHVAPIVLGCGPAWAESHLVARLRDAWRLCGLRAEVLGDGLKLTARVAR